MNNGYSLTCARLPIFAFQRGNNARTQGMLASRPLGATGYRFRQPRAIQSEISPNVHPIDWDSRILTNNHVLGLPKFDGLQVMRKNPFGYLLCFTRGRLANGRNYVRRNLLQRLNIQIAANILDQSIKAVLNFHKAAPVKLQWERREGDKILGRR